MGILINQSFLKSIDTSISDLSKIQDKLISGEDLGMGISYVKELPPQLMEELDKLLSEWIEKRFAYMESKPLSEKYLEMKERQAQTGKPLSKVIPGDDGYSSGLPVLHENVYKFGQASGHLKSVILGALKEHSSTSFMHRIYPGAISENYIQYGWEINLNSFWSSKGGTPYPKLISDHKNLTKVGGLLNFSPGVKELIVSAATEAFKAILNVAATNSSMGFVR